MRMIEPNAAQDRAAAYALILVAALTAIVMALAWGKSLGGPLLLPILVAYFVLNGGYVVAVIKSRLQSRGAKIGLDAVGLNFAAMLLTDYQAIWTLLSAASFAATICGASLLLREAKGAAA
jgi:undecaprenyl pyrophosphate phosphatase UppP